MSLKYFALLGPLAFLGGVHAAELTDGQIVETLKTLNEGEVDAATIAKKQSQTNTVKDFAKMMMDEHEKNLKDTSTLANEHKIEDKTSPVSEMLEKDTKASNQDLKAVPRSNFDKAYVAQQITMHKKALSLIKDELIPKAQNPALKKHLETTHKAVAMHLDHAKKLEKQLK